MRCQRSGPKEPSHRLKPKVAQESTCSQCPMRLLEVVEKAVLDARFDMPVTALSSRHALAFSNSFYSATPLLQEGEVDAAISAK